MNHYQRFRHWVKHSDHPVAARLHRLWFSLRGIEVPAVRAVYLPLGWLHQACTGAVSGLLRISYWTPLFKARLQSNAPQLYLYGGMPQLLGPLEINLGHGCNISGCTTFSGRGSETQTPQLCIGNQVSISWQTSIAVGRRVTIGDRVLIAGQCQLAGYPGHPMDAKDRGQGLPDTEDQIGDIVLEDDVWLASGVKVMAGVTIGQGTVVAAGSVVTRDLPANVLAAGIPARPIRNLNVASHSVEPVGNTFSASQRRDCA